MDIKQFRQLNQIEEHEKQTILKHIRPWPEPPMPYGALINATMHICIALMILNALSQHFQYSHKMIDVGIFLEAALLQVL